MNLFLQCLGMIAWVACPAVSWARMRELVDLAGILQVVDARVHQDAQHGVSEALKYLARCGSVDRKLVKQTVMTSVYGVTMIGARQQIEARLEERGWDNEDEAYTVRALVSVEKGCI